AKMIVVDPRFTRTASVADLFLQIRAGTDIAFLGGLINYAIQNNRIAWDYVKNYTNAAFLVKDGFKLPDDGLYSGFDANSRVYDKSTWNYQEGGNVTGSGAAGGESDLTNAPVASAAAPSGSRPAGSDHQPQSGTNGSGTNGSSSNSSASN